MHELKVPFDPRNPGQFYACCGLIELLELATKSTTSKFVIDSRRPHFAELIVKSESELDMSCVIDAVRHATYRTFKRETAEKEAEKDSIAPAVVSIFGREFILDWWLDEFHEKATSFKCWAGQMTTQKLISEMPKLVSESDLSFTSSAFTSTRFGVDPRSAWVALDLGYSPNEQGEESRTYPVVELLAAFGLEGFRPAGKRNSGFEYSLWLSELPLAIARTAAARPWDGLAATRFKFELGERGSYKVFCFAEPIST
jgi:CRISPR-associated protein Csx14